MVFEKKKIRVLIVDDSAFMRRVVREMLESDPGIEVIAAAKDGQEGVEMTLELDPDVVTMDIEMPRMNGIEAIEAIMARSPRPILVLSSITSEGAEVTLEALDKGAADYIEKTIARSVLDVLQVKKDLIDKVKAVARRRRIIASRVKKSEVPYVRPPVHKTAAHMTDLVVIGTSTGGPRAIQQVLPGIPKGVDAAFVIAVHMPKAFTKTFAERMDQHCALPVREAEDGDQLRPGMVLVAPGGIQTLIKRKSAALATIHLTKEPENSIYKPCIDLTIGSAAEAYGSRAMGVILTGMGHDGKEGIAAIKKKGGWALAQDEASCTVYGMPKAIVDAGLADIVSPLDKISAEIVKLL
jgi:two-component system chemotaxis response regulator CheB